MSCKHDGMAATFHNWYVTKQNNTISQTVIMVSQHLKSNWFDRKLIFLPQILLGGYRQSEACPDYVLTSKDQYVVLKVV